MAAIKDFDHDFTRWAHENCGLTGPVQKSEKQICEAWKD